jgi:hypothetical protein
VYQNMWNINKIKYIQDYTKSKFCFVEMAIAFTKQDVHKDELLKWTTPLSVEFQATGFLIDDFN